MTERFGSGQLFEGENSEAIPQPYPLAEHYADRLPITVEDGVTYGEWTSVERAIPSDAELHISSRLASVDAKTDVGGPRSKYTVNEDALFVVAKPDFLVLGVLDGMGGSKNSQGVKIGGKLASEIGAAVLAKQMRAGKNPLVALNRADVSVFQFADKAKAAAVIVKITPLEGVEDFEVSLANAGDCKAMTIRNNQKLDAGTTSMQNLGTFLHGTSADYFRQLNDSKNIFGGLGFGRTRDNKLGEPMSGSFEGNKGDILVLGSDGFWDVVSEYEIIQIANTSGTGQELQQKLFDLAWERNNAEGGLSIQYSAQEVVVLPPPAKMPNGSSAKVGDNLTVAVVVLGEP